MILKKISLQTLRKVLDTLESFWIPLKISGLWKVSGHSGKIWDTLESFQTLLKVSGHSGKFTDTLENFLDTLENGMFTEPLESFRTLWKVSGHFEGGGKGGWGCGKLSSGKHQSLLSRNFSHFLSRQG